MNTTEMFLSKMQVLDAEEESLTVSGFILIKIVFFYFYFLRLGVEQTQSK